MVSCLSVRFLRRTDSSTFTVIPAEREPGPSFKRSWTDLAQRRFVWIYPFCKDKSAPIQSCLRTVRSPPCTLFFASRIKPARDAAHSGCEDRAPFYTASLRETNHKWLHLV